MQTTSPATTVILVPGFWLGAWAWDDVLPHLRGHGLDPRPLTLPGLEPEHADRGAVSLEDQVSAIGAAIEAARDDSSGAGSGRVVLVAHSGAAVPATVALDRHAEQVDHVVWVDTAPVVDGFALDPSAEGPEHPLTAHWEDELEQGSMAGLSEEQLETFRRRAVPQPAASLREAAQLHDARRLDVPMTIVATAYRGEDYRSYAEQGVPFLAGLLEYRRLAIVDLPTGHWPMWSEPAGLAQVIAQVIDGDIDPAVAG